MAVNANRNKEPAAFNNCKQMICGGACFCAQMHKIDLFVGTPVCGLPGTIPGVGPGLGRKNLRPMANWTGTE